MKYRKNGRTYKLVRYLGCAKCAFYVRNDGGGCSEAVEDAGCPSHKMWRETLFSKIRNWIDKKCLCKWEPSPLHVWYSSCGYMPVFRPKTPFCPKCHKIIRMVR